VGHFHFVNWRVLCSLKSDIGFRLIPIVRAQQSEWRRRQSEGIGESQHLQTEAPP